MAREISEKDGLMCCIYFSHLGSYAYPALLTSSPFDAPDFPPPPPPAMMPFTSFVTKAQRFLYSFSRSKSHSHREGANQTPRPSASVLLSVIVVLAILVINDSIRSNGGDNAAITTAAQVYPKLTSSDLGKSLHDAYMVPWDILAVLPISDQRVLRDRLEDLEVRNIGRRRTSDKRESNFEMPRLLLCHCTGGLARRLRALASCMAFAKVTNRYAIYIWELDRHMHAKYDELFDTSLTVIDKFHPQWPFSGIEIEKWDSVWKYYKLYNYMQHEKGALRDETIVDHPQKHIYYKGASVMKFPRALVEWGNQLRGLQPVDFIQSELDKMEKLGISKFYTGIYIRSRSRKSAASLASFTKLMKILIIEKPSIKFFVASDKVESIEALEESFGSNRILSVKRKCDVGNGECVRYKLIDLLVLAKCKQLYGASGSSFTQVAETFGDIKAKLAGVDFEAR